MRSQFHYVEDIPKGINILMDLLLLLNTPFSSGHTPKPAKSFYICALKAKESRCNGPCRRDASSAKSMLTLLPVSHPTSRKFGRRRTRLPHKTIEAKTHLCWKLLNMLEQENLKNRITLGREKIGHSHSGGETIVTPLPQFLEYPNLASSTRQR